ncbi:hypothetical protein ACLKMY_16025 [Paraburkholderia mimosarum]|uniref:hypothetical protein n=1 Tax=Paraburkholderia mimosarum TaxID=312026 RepID=UPI0039C08E44
MKLTSNSRLQNEGMLRAPAMQLREQHHRVMMPSNESSGPRRASRISIAFRAILRGIEVNRSSGHWQRDPTGKRSESPTRKMNNLKIGIRLAIAFGFVTPINCPCRCCIDPAEPDYA